MTQELVEIIRRNSRPLDPRPTGVAPRLKPLPGVRAVLFDVYGTLFVSASGEVGTAADGQPEAFAAALAQMRIDCRCDAAAGVALFEQMIRREHERGRRRGIDYPEVNIVEIWRQTLAELAGRGQLEPARIDADRLQRLAVEFETRANPVWPMPGLAECLEQLAVAGLRLGLVSNAQFFTPLLFPALLRKSLRELGFAQNLQFYSFQHGQAKPGSHLHRLARETLASCGIEPDEVVYIGNDMLNDVVPARQVGFRTALFAGDARSLRLRTGDERVEGVQPDLIVTALDQLASCLTP